MSDTLLGLVLTRLDQVDASLLLHREAMTYPPAELKDLLSKHILRETSRATQVSRPADMPAGSDLLVRETSNGVFGVADEDDYHLPVRLKDDDVRQYEILVPALLERIRSENDLKGALAANGRRLFLVGERVLPDGYRANVYISLLNDDQSQFMRVCRGVQSPDKRPVIVLVPRWIPLTIENNDALRDRNVFVLPLSPHLGARNWKLPWDQVLKTSVGREEPQRGIEKAYCRAVTRKGAVDLTKPNYESLLKKRETYDMFIDGVTRIASCRHVNGKSRTSTLTAKELGILTDYIESAGAMRPSSTKTGAECSSDKSACKLFETARGKVDAKLGRYKYRAFRLHKNPTDPTLKSFEFAPPEDFTYCLILSA